MSTVTLEEAQAHLPQLIEQLQPGEEIVITRDEKPVATVRAIPPAQDERRAAAVAMLNRWVEEDAKLPPEEAAANTAVLRALDEDRPSYRKLFADILKDDPQ
jgi:antitoxin (DNA-binding transcriptional repressor) of toxin-antitoxin stability system